MLSIGIVGLPNVGKSTLFNALTRSNVEASNYPFCTIEPNTRVVEVEDPRLYKISEIISPDKVVPASVKFVDIAGLVEGASKGEGLGNEFLGNIRGVDAICHVVRCFEDSSIVHARDTIDPVEDMNVINTELLLADLEIATKRCEELEKAKKTGKADVIKEYEIFKIIKDGLSEGRPVSEMISYDKRDFYKRIGFLTAKPVLIIANILEDDISGRYFDKIQELKQVSRLEVIQVSAKLEAELSELSDEEAKEFKEIMGLSETGLSRVIKAGYDMLGLITFFTVTGGKEVRAWPIPKGTGARIAAGKVHSDMERGFIKADVISFKDLDSTGNITEAREKGLLRSEGAEYQVKDGDVIHFKFNV